MGNISCLSAKLGLVELPSTPRQANPHRSLALDHDKKMVLPRGAKESACGCAGLYTAHAGIELYAEAFDQAGALGELEAFASRNGPAFYGLEPNRDIITLRRESWSVPGEMPMGDDVVVPFRAGGRVAWRLVT